MTSIIENPALKTELNELANSTIIAYKSSAIKIEEEENLAKKIELLMQQRAMIEKWKNLAMRVYGADLLYSFGLY